jgi:hypothetical protein
LLSHLGKGNDNAIHIREDLGLLPVQPRDGTRQSKDKRAEESNRTDHGIERECRNIHL